MELTSTEVERLTLQKSESGLEKAVEVALNVNWDRGLKRELVVLMDSRPSPKALELLRNFSSTKVGDVLLVLFGDDVISSYEVNELKKTFKILLVKNTDSDLLLKNLDDGVDGEESRSQIPLRIIDIVKSTYTKCF